MSKFIPAENGKVTYQVNAEAIAFLEVHSDKATTVHFIGGEKLYVETPSSQIVTQSRN